LFQFIDKSNFVIWLADADGYMIKVVRAPNYHIGSTKQITAEIREGNCFAEHVLGANGCGTPLVTGEPIQIQGAEHYCLRAHGLASCGAPVRGPEGNIIGSIGITGKKELIHAHTLGMVVATANAINKELKLREIDRQKQVILESLSEGIFVLNTEGYVTYQNPAAKRILEVDFNLVGKKLGFRGQD